MPHIHTESGQYDHTASAFIVRLDRSEPTVLLHMHKKLHKYLQFGGHIELDETPWQSVAHEVREESGYELSQLRLLQPKTRIKRMSDPATMHPVPLYQNSHGGFDIDHMHIDIGYAFVTREDPSGLIKVGESDIITEFTRKELVELAANKVVANVREICLFIFDDVLGSYEEISVDEFAL